MIIQGPTPSVCHANDRVLTEDYAALPMELKGLLTQVYLKMKHKAYIAVIGLHWKVQPNACAKFSVPVRGASSQTCGTVALCMPQHLHGLPFRFCPVFCICASSCRFHLCFDPLIGV